MGELGGFLKYDRQNQDERDTLKRLHDYEDFHEPATLQNQKEQAARCMECAVPFCSSGMILSGAASGCPLSNLIPEWNDLLFHGRMREAAERLHRTDPFPEFTSRVCPAPCEGACVCSIHQDAVTIRQNEWAIIDHAFAFGYVKPQIPQQRTGKRIAVVGSGPSGLACANLLNQMGHLVTVFEKADRPGGLLMYGIPSMKLDKKLVMRRIELLIAEGISFETSCEIGKDKTADEITNAFDAVVLCCGTKNARDLNVEGRGARGVSFAVDYLSGVTKKQLNEKYELPEEMDAAGKRVVIIGGGDTGTDCVASAIRQGAVSVTQLEIMPPPPKKRAESNPWPEYPRVFKTDYGQKEALAFFGGDPRLYCVTAEKILQDEAGNVSGVVVSRVKWEMKDGRRIPDIQRGTEKTHPAQMVLIAMGFSGPERALLEAFGVPLSAQRYMAAEGYKANDSNIFVAGDMRIGQSLVVRALDEGQKAARAVHAALS